ncbi:UNVERIFIED_CONTAM: hypothetical protein RMT77_012908 [Armadillidium vulgare]
MDIKEKLKSFIDKQKFNLKANHNIQESVTKDDFQGRIAIFSQHQRIGSYLDEHKLTPEAEKAVIESIEAPYFEVDGVDVGELELKKFPDITDIHVINGIRSRLRKQHAVVTKCVSNLILQKQGLYTKEIECIAEIQQELCKAISLCHDGRASLKEGRTQFTTASLGILSKYSKRQRVADVIESLKTIRTLQMTDVQLQVLLKAEDYPGAIQLLLECQKAAETFKHFHCISELSSKLQDTLEMVEEQLDSAVSRVALNFSQILYEKLVIAFGLFNKTQIMLDQLHMHLTSHIHNTAFNIILGYVELYNTSINNICNGQGNSNPSFSKLQYSELCKNINQEFFLACFLDLSKSMWNILKNYHSIIKWHKETKTLKIGANDNTVSTTDIDAQDNYIKQKLDHGLIRLWQDVQAKVRTYILASDPCHFKFDDFLKVLGIINKLIEVGKSFCDSQSETLQDSIKAQSLSFFRSHHSTRMEQLHMFLENEGWEICPVKYNFHINQLVEYRFLKEDFGAKLHTPLSSPRKEVEPLKKNLFEMFDEGSPFDSINEDCIEENIMADEVTENALSEDDSDDELSEELKRDFVDEQTGEKPNSTVKKKKDIHKVPMVTNTTLTILRLFGKYIQMMKLLQPITFDVFRCLSHLFEYYMYAVFTLFTDRGISDSNLSPRLRTTLQGIEERLILKETNVDENEVDKVPPPPTLGPNILKDLPESLYSLPVRVIAVESLLFLSQQLEFLQSQIESLMPSSNSKKNFLQKFYSNTVLLTSEVRIHVYMHVASRVVDYDSLVNQMSSVKWDISDLMSQHSPYVDVLLRQLQILSMRIEELRRSHPIPSEAEKCLWESVIRYTHRALLEGFASAKKCTNEGRSLMQLDYQQFLMKLDCLTPVRPIPDRHLVESYIKAYYLPDNALEEWVNTNQTSYSTRQLVSLISCMTRISKKTKQKIISVLEDATPLK